MKATLLAVGVASAIAFTATPALADHNSKNGEGWANMPNDIHNTRIETREADDNEAFRDFVKYGEGSESVNRFASDDTTAKRAKEQAGNARAAQSQTSQMGGVQTQTKQKGGTQTQTQQMGGTQSRTQTKLMDGTGTNPRIQEQKRLRTDTATGSGTRQRSSRQSGGRKGGKR